MSLKSQIANIMDRFKRVLTRELEQGEMQNGSFEVFVQDRDYQKITTKKTEK